MTIANDDEPKIVDLSPIIGYDKAAEISYYAIDHDLTPEGGGTS